MHVIGTAGHVDHGKSTLIEALTGIDPDRLKEEKDRAMTIDLGFAWIKDGDEEDEIGVIDVPGHRDFIENMLAGVGGIDLALLVIAADEGVMPQSKEHLAILDLLNVKAGIVVLTKIDLVDDPDWLELVQLDIAETLQNTILEDAEIIPVSAVTGENISKLLSAIRLRLSQIEEKVDNGRPRLPIDRIFSLSGFGTIVTGTLIDGSLRTGDAVEIQPMGLQGRIRGLQTHQTKIDVARPGSRVAVNLSGVAKNEISRGAVLSHPDTVTSTILCDAQYRHLTDAVMPLKHNTEVKLFVGSAEVVARVRIIGDKHLKPGQNGWLQFALREPMAVTRGDRFIIRRPSPPATLGGGVILDPYPGRRHRRFNLKVRQKFETLESGSPEDVLLLIIERNEPIPIKNLLDVSGLDQKTATSAWQALTDDGRAFIVEEEVHSRERWSFLRKKLITIVNSYHASNPLRIGISREELRSRLDISSSLFSNLLKEVMSSGDVQLTGNLVHMPGHSITFSPKQKADVQKMTEIFLKAGVNSPSVKETKSIIGEDVYFALIDLVKIVQLNQEVVYLFDTYNSLVNEIIQYVLNNGSISAGQTRDILNTSRKYAIALLEHMDHTRITKRRGDERVLMNVAEYRLK